MKPGVLFSGPCAWGCNQLPPSVWKASSTSQVAPLLSVNPTSEPQPLVRIVTAQLTGFMRRWEDPGKTLAFSRIRRSPPHPDPLEFTELDGVTQQGSRDAGPVEPPSYPLPPPHSSGLPKPGSPSGKNPGETTPPSLHLNNSEKERGLEAHWLSGGTVTGVTLKATEAGK